MKTYTDAELARIDALVAERVMGWKVYGQPHHEDGTREYPHCWTKTLAGRTTLYVFDGTDNRQWQPTRDIATAMGVFSNKHVVKHVESMYFSSDDDDAKIMHWVVVTTINGSRCGNVDDKLELAISLAALRAVGVDVDAELAKEAK